MNHIHPSDEQNVVIEGIKKGYNGVVNAVAGAGKTTTVLYLAHINCDKKVIQLTYNSELKAEVKQKIVKCSDHLSLDNLSVYTYHSLGFQYYTEEAKTDIGISEIVESDLSVKQALPLVEILVLDEIQDMNELYFRFILKFIKDCGKEIQILILGDKYQGLYEFKGADTRYLTLGSQIFGQELSPHKFKTWKLSTSYRVTNQIADFVNHVMLGKYRMKAVKDGPPVCYIRHTNSFQNYKIIGRKIIEMIHSGYAKPEDIFVLAASVKSESTPIKLIENMLVSHGIPCYVPMNEASSINNEVIKHKVIFSSFHQSKGRERKVVVVYGFDESYFQYFNRDAPRNKCPSTLYVAVTRATECLILVETAEPLTFLKYGHPQLMNSPFVNFEGIPLGLRQIGGDSGRPKTPEKNIYKTSPSELIKFLDESVLVKIAKIMEDHLFITDLMSYPFNEVYIGSKVRTRQTDEDAMYEEVFDITGLSIPALYEERGRKDGSNTIKDFVKGFLLTNDATCVFYKNRLSDVDFENTSLQDQLLITNIYVSIREKLYFKVAQLNSYTWLTPPVVERIFCNIDRHLKRESDLQYEVIIVKQNENERYQKMDAFIDEHLGSKFGNIRFKAIVDAINDDVVWEFKCVDIIDVEHRLQVVIYAWIWHMICLEEHGPRKFKIMNIKTAEVQTLNPGDMTWINQIMILLLNAKFKKREMVSDEDFLEKCHNMHFTKNDTLR